MPTPQAGPQTDFILMDDSMPLVFYGGAAGGGKALDLDTKVLVITWKSQKYFLQPFKKR